MDDPHYGLQVLRDQRAARATFARSIQDSLSDIAFYSTSVQQLERTIRQTLHEDSQYHDLTGEPMREHHKEVQRAELAHWLRYDDLLRATPVAENDYAQFCAGLRGDTAQLMRILALEQEILTSPLMVHYANQLASMIDPSIAPNVTRDPPRALAQVRNARAERQHLAYNTYRHLLRGSFFAAGTTDLTYAIHHAGEEQAFYEDSTGERYPSHADRACKLEVALWQHLLNVREQGTTSPGRRSRRLVPVARVLQRVLELQDDLLTTPLVAYYDQRLDALGAAARRADRMFAGTP